MRTLNPLLFVALASCAATCPAPVPAERADAFADAQACVLASWESHLGRVPDETREAFARARLAEVGVAEFERRCPGYCAAHTQPSDRCPAGLALACLASCDAETHAPWEGSSAPLVVTLSGSPAIERAQGEPWIHELLHVLAYDRGHARRDVWAQHGEDSAQARARSCFVAP